MNAAMVVRAHPTSTPRAVQCQPHAQAQSGSHSWRSEDACIIEPFEHHTCIYYRPRNV